MTLKERREIQAQLEHPTLHKLGQNGFVRALGGLLWTPKAEKKARRHAAPVPRYTAPHAPHMQPMVVHIYAGGHAHFN